MLKKRNKKIIFGLSLAQIYLLVTMIFAFAFILNQEVNVTSAAGPIGTGSPPPTTDLTVPGASAVDTTAKSVDAVGTSGTVFETGEGLSGSTISTDGLTVGYFNEPLDVGLPSSGAGSSVSRSWGDLVQAPFKGQIFHNPGANTWATEGFGGLGNSLIQGVAWGALIGGVLYMIGGMLGVGKKNQQVMFQAGLLGGLAGGIAKWAVNSFAEKQTFLGLSAGKFGSLFGIGVGAVIIIMMWSESKTQMVAFNCAPWEPPIGGAKCEECNKDPMKPCSEYRCKSLGQACDIVNKGTDKEQCVWISRNDVNSPKISVWNNVLTDGLRYSPLATRPMDRGAKIVKIGEKECLAAYTPLQFGIITDEPAQCKLDYLQKNYSDMQFYFGDSNYYEKNHTQKMRLPSPVTASGETAPLFKNDGTMQLWIQCQDANGNKNTDLFLIEFCVDKSPDTTAPIIEDFSVNDNSPVSYKIDQFKLDAYLNEPAQCKWSKQDKNYDSMENSMVCSNSALEINGNLQYTCSGNVTGIKDREKNEFFFRCRDPAGNTNTESRKLTLRGSQPLNILSIAPNETVYGSTTTVSVNITIETDDGSDEGKAKCYYSGPLTDGFTEMLETNNYIHKQILSLASGTYNYQFRCIDDGGNAAEQNATFVVFVDNQAPLVTRTYKDTSLKIVTNENAECSYSKQNCNFELDKGIKMEYANINTKNQLFAPWESGVTYYIKCIDAYGNQPLPNECSVIVSPRTLGIVEAQSGTTGVISGVVG